MTLSFKCLAVFGLGLLVACGNESVPDIDPSERLPGGEGSVSYKPFASLMKPVANLPHNQLPDFHAGKALAHQPWVKAPTITTARDGLGPLYNARTCLDCHVNGGRGHIPEVNNRPLKTAFIRISIPGVDEYNGVVPDPVYGDQIQTQSVALFHQLKNHVSSEVKANSNEAAPEATVTIEWQNKIFTYPDGQAVELRYPKLNIYDLAYGDLHPQALLSLRNAPPIHGVGLVELIDQQDIVKNEDPKDRDNNGISGRVNYVWDADQKKQVAGRFGLKANRPANLRTVTAAAFRGDMGITNSLFPEQPCTQAQVKCLTTPNGNDEEGVELPDHLLDLTTGFIRQIGVPKRRISNKPAIKKGRALFYEAGCHQCHTPAYVTTASDLYPHLAHQKIWPYSDFLLHDMGEALADGRPDFAATGSEWRTAPLWGVGLSKAVNGNQVFLHDGRARSIEEAVLWHGGEAEGVKQKFIHMTRQERRLLIEFVESL